MATIAQNLQKIIDSKAAIKASINAKGGTITDSTPLDEYSTAIDNIPSGGSAYATLVDDTTVETIISKNAAYFYNDPFLKTVDLSNFSGNSTIYSFFQSASAGNGTYNITLEEVKCPNSVNDATISVGDSRFRQYLYLRKFTGTASKFSWFAANAFQYCTNLETFLTGTPNVSYIYDSMFQFAGYDVYVNDNSKRGCLGEFIITNNDNTQKNNCFNGANFSKLTLNIKKIGTCSAGILGTTVEIGDNCASFNNKGIAFGGNCPYMDYSNYGIYSHLVTEQSLVETLIMKATTPPTLLGGALVGNNLQHIYVPAASVEAYKTATNWLDYASIISANPNE